MSGYDANQVVQDSAGLSDGRTASQFVSRLIKGLGSEESFDAHHVLEQHPSLMRCKSAVLDLALEQYWRQFEAGEEVDPSRFAREFPEYQHSVRRLLEAFDLVDSGMKSALAADIDKVAVGDELLGFKLQELLGRGAFSRVFLASEPSAAGRTVVVKFCRFGEEEVKTLAALKHPAIVELYSVERDEKTGLTAICMPFHSRTTLHDVMDQAGGSDRRRLSGSSILEVLRRRNGVPDEAPLSYGARLLTRKSFVAAAVDLALQLAEGLAHAHGRGICHGDIKPSNVLLTPDGKAMLFDFNLSYTLDDKQRVGGTLPYMSPEHLQAMAERRDDAIHVDPRSDLFSFGVLLYELLCGELPFGDLPTRAEREALIPQLLQRQRGGASSLHRKNPQVDRHLARLIDRCLRFDPEQRMPSAEHLAEALRTAQGHHVRRWVRANRRQALLLGLGGAGAAMAGSAALFAYLTRPVPSAEEVALERGLEAFRAKDYQLAADALSNVPAEMMSYEALLARGRSYMLTQRYQEAKDDFMSAAGHTPHHGASEACNSTCSAYLANIHRDKYGYRAADITLRILRDNGYDNPAVINNIAYCKIRLTDREQRWLAKEMLEELVNKGRALPQVYLNLAEIDMLDAQEERPSRPPRVELIEQALAGMSGRRKLHEFAAGVYLRAAQEGGADQAPEMVDKALAQLAKAVELGASKAPLKNVPTFYSPLEVDPRFKRLLQQAPDESSPALPAALADPLLGDDSRLFDSSLILAEPSEGLQADPEPRLTARKAEKK